MSFEHKRSSRHPINWLIAVIATFLGVPITFFCGIGIIYDSISFGPLLGLLVGISFSITGMFFIYRIIVTKEFTRVVSKEMIVFKSNGVATHHFIKDDIEMIDIT